MILLRFSRYSKVFYISSIFLFLVLNLHITFLVLIVSNIISYFQGIFFLFFYLLIFFYWQVVTLFLLYGMGFCRLASSSSASCGR